MKTRLKTIGRAKTQDRPDDQGPETRSRAHLRGLEQEKRGNGEEQALEQNQAEHAAGRVDRVGRHLE